MGNLASATAATTTYPERPCTACLANNQREPAVYRARGLSGLEWFECAEHGELDNVAEDRRVELIPIGEWFDRISRLWPEEEPTEP